MHSADIIKQLKVAGWRYVSTRGSHHKYRHPVSGKSVVVPYPKKDLPLGTAESILKQAELSEDENVISAVCMEG
jgi:predicted RNA binding protein YcfA (HicA-like mRNA interferase family)